MIRKNSLSFQANIHSPKLRFKQEDFFVHIRGYGKNSNWANDIKKTADLAVDLFRRDTDIENVLKLISLGVKNANKTNTLDLMKKLFSGFLRVPRKDWASKPWTNLVTPYNKGKYNNYRNRLDYIAAHPLHPTQAPDYSRPIINNDGTRIILHGSAIYINKNLDKIFELSKQILPKYIYKDAQPENMTEINSIIAEIRWILAHSTPWLRGSDTIANILMRAMYKAIGIKSYPIKKGVSLDLEAYCTELSDYKKQFPAYFEKPPEIIE